MVESLHDFDEKYSFILYPRWMAKKVDKLQKSKTKAFGSFSLFLEPKEYFFSFVKIYDNGWDAMVIPGANNVYWDLQVFKDFPNPMFVRTFTYGWYKI